MQDEIEPPKIKYCLNSKNWEDAKKNFLRISLVVDFFLFTFAVRNFTNNEQK